MAGTYPIEKMNQQADAQSAKRSLLFLVGIFRGVFEAQMFAVGVQFFENSLLIYGGNLKLC